jgi:hypothetical protein
MICSQDINQLSDGGVKTHHFSTNLICTASKIE